jgi:hypothetical protein
VPTSRSAAILAGKRTDEALARGTRQQREPEPVQFIKPRHQLKVHFGILCEAEARIEQDLIIGNSCTPGDLERWSKPRKLIGDRISPTPHGHGRYA